MKWREWNWWKIGFFAAILAFEVAREIAVIQAYAPPNFAISIPFAHRSKDGSFVTASGRWERTDGGEAMVPAAISIECERSIGSCTMVTASAYDGYIHLPEIDRRPAVFTATGAEFTDDWPECNQLFVRIDAVHELTTAVRSSKPSSNPMCKAGEKIQLRLGGFQKDEFDSWRNKHFVPLMDGLVALLRLLD